MRDLDVFCCPGCWEKRGDAYLAHPAVHEQRDGLWYCRLCGSRVVAGPSFLMGLLISGRTRGTPRVMRTVR